MYAEYSCCCYFCFFFIFIKCFDSFLIICMQGGSNKQAGWLAGWIERVMGITYKTDGDWDDVNLYVEPFSELWWKFEMRRSRVVWSVLTVIRPNMSENESENVMFLTQMISKLYVIRIGYCYSTYYPRLRSSKMTHYFWFFFFYITTSGFRIYGTDMSISPSSIRCLTIAILSNGEEIPRCYPISALWEITTNIAFSCSN